MSALVRACTRVHTPAVVGGLRWEGWGGHHVYHRGCCSERMLSLPALLWITWIGWRPEGASWGHRYSEEGVGPLPPSSLDTSNMWMRIYTHVYVVFIFPQRSHRQQFHGNPLSTGWHRHLSHPKLHSKSCLVISLTYSSVDISPSLPGCPSPTHFPLLTMKFVFYICNSVSEEQTL